MARPALYTVDEIDVGRLKEGMTAEMKVGALPKHQFNGTLTKISLKAEKKENATVFPIEISIPVSSNSVLRAGYSANASIIIQRKYSVLIIPERTVTFRNDSAFVDLPLGAEGKDTACDQDRPERRDQRRGAGGAPGGGRGL